MGKIKIIDVINIEVGIRNLNGYKSKKEYINLVSKKISKYKRIKNVFFAIQNEDVIIREYRNLGIIKKRDMYGYINFEILHDMPINLDDYTVKYKILNKNRKIMDLQIILFPKELQQICVEIAESVGVKHKYLNMDFDIVQKLIKKKKINLGCDECMIIENLEDIIILNSVKESVIHTSNVFEKEGNVDYILNFLQKDIHIFYYGNEDDFLKQIIKNGFKVDKLETNLKINDSCLNKTVDKNTSKHIINVGLVV